MEKKNKILLARDVAGEMEL